MAAKRQFSAALAFLQALVVMTEPVPQQQWSNETQQARFMRRCVELADEAVDLGGAPFGCLIADPASGGRVLVEGRNHAGRNPIWHGEMDAIDSLAQFLKPQRVRDVAPSLELYTTAEPCAMCMGAGERC